MGKRIFDKLKTGIEKNIRLMNNFVFFLLFFSMQVGNQPLYIGPLRLTILFVLPAVLIACLTFIIECPSPRVTSTVMLFIFVVIALVFVFHQERLKLVLEIFSYFFLMYSAAFMVAHHKNKFIFQVCIILFVSLFFALFQVSGTSPWSQLFSVLADDVPGMWMNGEEEYKFSVLSIIDMAQYLRYLNTTVESISINVLISPERFLSFPLTQYRPAGIIVTNNVLSLFVLVGFAVTLRQQDLKFYFYLIPLCLLMVLSMAKIVFLGFLVLCIFSILQDRFRYIFQIVICCISSTCFFVVYHAFLGPYAEVTLSKNTFITSLFLRMGNFINQIPKDSFIFKVIDNLIDHKSMDIYLMQDTTSSYQILLHSPLILIVVFIPILMVFIYYCFYWKKLQNCHVYADLTRMSGSLLIVLILYLCAVPYHKAKIYWFFMGAALAPVFLLFNLLDSNGKRQNGCPCKLHLPFYNSF